MKPLATVAAAVSAISIFAAFPAGAATYTLNDYQANFSPPVGTITVTGQNTNVLSFDVSLAPDVYFQQLGNGSVHDAFWFDLTGLVGTAVTYNITSPDGPAPGTGDFGAGGDFVGEAYHAGYYGQGFLKGFNYEIADKDTIKPIDYYTGHLSFTVTGATGSHLNLAGQLIDGVTVYAGADLRECALVCVTGPVGATADFVQNAVPEPATWALMILGFGGVGGVLRRRKAIQVAAAA